MCEPALRGLWIQGQHSRRDEPQGWEEECLKSVLKKALRRIPMRRLLQEIECDEVTTNRELRLPPDLSLRILPVQPGAERLCWVTDAVSRGSITSVLPLDISSFLPQQIQRGEGKGFDVVRIRASLPQSLPSFSSGRAGVDGHFLACRVWIKVLSTTAFLLILLIPARNTPRSAPRLFRVL